MAALRTSLDQLDADAQLAGNPDQYTSDIALAMSLFQSIKARSDELVATWDSGRAGPEELARLAVLMWGRLPDPLGAPSAFTLTEAGTLAAALTDRLAAALSADAVAGSGVAGRIVSVRAAIDRCRAQAEVLGMSASHLAELTARLDAALESKDREQIVTTVTTLDTEVTSLERDLIKETGLRASTAHLLAQLQLRYTELEPRAAAVSAVAERCRSRITDPPVLAVPDVTALGEPPGASTNDASTASEWAAARAELDEYSRRIDRCAAALDEAEARYGAPLAAREDLRGLLGAYRTRVGRSGLAEDVPLTDAYRAARDVLWTAPCDLREAQELVERYQRMVRVAVGADHVVEARFEREQP